MGILHICTNGAWGTVCLNSYWSNIDANVACYELGYFTYGLFNCNIIYISVISIGNTYESGWTDEKYPFIYTRIDCSGTNTRLRSCSSSVSSSIQYCSNNQIVKLKCGGKYYL